MKRLPGNKVAVLGLGVTGCESALFLHREGYQVFVSELKTSAEIEKKAERLLREGILCETGRHSADKILSADWVLISPGIPPFSDIYRKISEKAIPIVSEIEVATWFSPSDRIIGITGTSGKTTVTTLITQILRETGYSVLCCGNIGNPWIAELPKMTPETFVVLELSSFQLQHCLSFRPFIGVLLNLSPNHEDWHRDFEEYKNAKLKMFACQRESDFAVCSEDLRRKVFPDFSFKSKMVDISCRTGEDFNQSAARIAAKLAGCSDQTADHVFKNFKGIEHRLERFARIRGIEFINDSKSTTTASLCWALHKMPDHKTILIAGGHPKSSDFDQALPVLKQKVKKAVLIGEAAPQLRAFWQGACPLLSAEDFQTAVNLAFREAAEGDTVLLSPACASFDMFKNYQERGEIFKKLVRGLDRSGAVSAVSLDSNRVKTR